MTLPKPQPRSPRASRSRRGRKTKAAANPDRIIARLDSLRRAFPSDAAVAEALEVSRAAPGRWRGGALPDADTEARLIALDTVISLLAIYLEPSTALKWLRGPDPYLGDRPPLAMLQRGQLAEVVRAIHADQAGVPA